MPSSPLSSRLARGYAVLRGAMLLLFAVAMFAAPERAVAGSSTPPASWLVLMVASRTLVLGAALAALGVRNRRAALAWVLFADAALQVFDTGLALATGRGPQAVFPAALCVLDVLAGLALLRAASTEPR